MVSALSFSSELEKTREDKLPVNAFERCSLCYRFRTDSYVVYCYYSVPPMVTRLVLHLPHDMSKRLGVLVNTRWRLFCKVGLWICSFSKGKSGTNCANFREAS